MSDQKDQTHTSDLASDLPAAAAALSAEDRADLVNAIKNKLQELSMGHSDSRESLSPNVRKRVDSLREIQSQHDELEAKFFEERAALEAKFQKLYEPLYTKRYDIVNGVIEIEGISYKNSTGQTIEEKGVPNFWLTAMKNNETLAKEITEHDKNALHYLKDIKWSRIDGAKGFKLEFFFHPNPYFTNSVLTKTYSMISEEEHILDNAIGTQIQWLPGKNLTQKILKKKPKKGSNKDTKPIMKIEDCQSFFLFFNPPQLPEEDEEIEEEAAELLQCQLEQDYEIGSAIREKIIPHAVSWFTGEAVRVDEDGDDTEDDDVNNEEEEETEDDVNENVDNEEHEKKTDK